MYLMKDTNKCWSACNSRFSKRNLNPSNVDGVCQDANIADVFCDSFILAQFNSYSDCEGHIDCFNNVKNATVEEMCDERSDYINLFDIGDIENSLHSLKLGKAL